MTAIFPGKGKATKKNKLRYLLEKGPVSNLIHKHTQEKIVAEVRTVHKKSSIHDQLFLYLSDPQPGSFFHFIKISLPTFEIIIS